LRRKPESSDDATKPKIWATGGQRPPFDIRAFGRVSLLLSREAVAPIHAWAARTTRRVAVNVKNGAGRIPEAKLGRAARFVPSHLRVAAWIKNFAAILSHASASADPDVKRGNALVTAIEPHLWGDAAAPAVPPEPSPDAELPAAEPEREPEPGPVVLPEPMQSDDDPLASIRDDLEGKVTEPRARTSARTSARRTWARTPDGPAGPPAPPGPTAVMAIQVAGYLIGWGTSIAALPYGLIRALWLYFAKSQDLRKIGLED
jgi:hypothetical protein